jgi:hypothetical protein
MADTNASTSAPVAPAAVVNGSGKSALPPSILQAIYGTVDDKKAAYENSLRRWVAVHHIWEPWMPRRARRAPRLILPRHHRRGCRWWTEYADRKNDEEDEHVADSLLYDRSHLPRSAPAPDCVAQAPPPAAPPAPAPQ